tara:strand:+ start:408 stop:569 length:162 start_codon:yes stop_codon:yes gene_type:complete
MKTINYLNEIYFYLKKYLEAKVSKKAINEFNRTQTPDILGSKKGKEKALVRYQ